jgi:anti-sigma-K factor RskA
VAIYLHPRLGVLLIASNLPPLSANQAYEMWVIPKGGAPRPAGVFQSAQDGTAIHVLGEAIDITQVGAVAVTIEPASGSAAPTMPIIIAAQLGA